MHIFVKFRLNFFTLKEVGISSKTDQQGHSLGRRLRAGHGLLLTGAVFQTNRAGASVRKPPHAGFLQNRAFRKQHGDGCAPARSALQLKPRAVILGGVLDDGQAQPRAAELA